MKLSNIFLKFGFITLMTTLLYSCSSEDDITNNVTPEKTSLFEKVTEPDATYENTSLDFFTLSETSSRDSSSPTWGGGNPNGQFEPGILTAGEWNDLNNWEFWNNLLNNQEYYKDVNKWNLKEIKRYSFIVQDNNNSSVANAEITLLAKDVEIWKTKTDSKGKATLWANMEIGEVTANIELNGANETIRNVKEFTEGTNNVSLNTSILNNKIVDIYFAVDATGSMGDEINYLKAELNNVIQRVKQNNTSIEMRFGSVFYRDKGDEYITRSLNFTANETDLTSFISNQNADGGGDFPEAVHSALDVAILQNTWNSNASTRILFLLLDAPPHYNQEVISSLESNIIEAAEKGIKIIPISASGIDKATEYLMRSFAILTNGTYIFITDDSGVGNSHLEPTIGEFNVEKLNDLMVKVIDNYIPQ